MEDLQAEEDKVNHMQKLKAKLEQQLDDVRISPIKSCINSLN